MTFYPKSGYSHSAPRKRKLTDEQVRAIRLVKGKEREVAKQFGVSTSCVGDIRRRKRKAQIPD